MQSLTLRAKNAAELDEWIDAIMKPLEELSTAPTAPPAADAKPAVPAAGAGDAAPAAGAGAAS
ncbi:hypothetical protein EON66_05515 [archaeon]|nr:MAG: hypothetical protein EON66_05515 [archaeon]